MSVDLSLIIADLENKIAAADSNTPVLNLLQMITAAERLTGGKNVYDSAGVLPTGNEYLGTIAMTADGTIRVYSGESGGWDTLDSSSYTAPTPPSHFPGSTSGYTSGGTEPAVSNVIDKFSFSTDGNATDVGDLTVGRSTSASQSSSTNGYTSGGVTTGVSNVIDKFPFSADANATDVGDLTASKRLIGGGQSSSANGYTSAGYTTPPAATGNQNVIEKFPFSVDANSADVGDLTIARQQVSGQSSSSDGYTSGGGTPGYTNTIDKFPFSADANATDVGDLTEAITNSAGQSSDTHGYRSGGDNPNIAPTSNLKTVDKFSFSADGNATDVGDITQNSGGTAGQSSTTSGYNSGGWAPGGVRYDYIDKFPFTTDANATDVGDLTIARLDAMGQQV